MSKYEMIALDIDGTLLDSQLNLTPGNRAAIHRAAAAGKHIVISTGRCLVEIDEILKALPEVHYLVCENGSCVYDCTRKENIHVDAIPAPDVLRILEEARRAGAVVQVFSDNRSYFICDNDDWLEPCEVSHYRDLFHACSSYDLHFFDDFAQSPVPIEKINLYFSSAQAREESKARLAGLPLAASDSFSYMVELVSDAADKGRGLRMLCRHMGLSMENLVAVGDSMNDVSMLKAAGCGVAMGNACSGAKAAADFITNDCDHDGVARVIDEVLMA